MTNLGCSVENCSYNKEHLCSLNEIKVGGDNAVHSDSTCCASFKEKSESSSNCSNCGCAKEETDIACEACNCMYNKDKCCYASSIDICGCHASKAEHTECATFSCK